VGATAGIVLAMLLLVGPSVPALVGSSGIPDALLGTAVEPAASTFTASVSFQGTPVASHTSPGSAIATSFSGNFVTVFQWASPNQATVVTKAVLNVQFLGATVGTSANSIQNAVAAESGTINLSSNFQQDKYLFEGVYQVQASLFDQGQAIWNTTFYVWVQAADHLTLVNIALILIALLEIYEIAALGSVRVARKQLGLEPPKKNGGS
jgi:hypothetical protein